HLNETVAVDLFVELPIHQSEPPAEWCAALAAVAGAGMAPQPEVVVALHSQLEKLIERSRTCRSPQTNAGGHFVVAACRARKPMRQQPAAQRREGPAVRGVKPVTPNARCGGSRERESRFGNAQQPALNAEVAAQRHRALKEGEFVRRQGR